MFYEMHIDNISSDGQFDEPRVLGTSRPEREPEGTFCYIDVASTD